MTILGTWSGEWGKLFFFFLSSVLFVTRSDKMVTKSLGRSRSNLRKHHLQESLYLFIVYGGGGGGGCVIGKRLLYHIHLAHSDL